MRLAEHDSCTGCGACAAVCPKQAIGWKNDAAGFPVPAVDAALCVDCGACERACPALNPPVCSPIRKAYAAQLKNHPAALGESTSGGVFTALALEVFARGGVVYGCVWTPDCRAEIARAENEAELAPMRGSKYVWSSAFSAYARVREDLDAGRTVLFSGLPCQIAGLKKTLRKEYEGLVLLDHLCAGAPSPMALDLYLDTICKKEDRPALNLKFRDKNPGGVGVHITWTGQQNPARRKAEHLRNPYYYAFYTHLSIRSSCYTCSYGGENRAADLTMGDFWGISKVFPDMKIKDGVSALLVNSEKGAALLEKVAGSLELRAVEPAQIAAANNLFVGGKTRRFTVPANRAAFFEVLAAHGWADAEKRFLHNRGRSLRLIKALLPPGISGLIGKFIK